MAKKQSTKRVSAAKKKAVVIRMSQTDCDQILKVLKHLQEPMTGKRTRLVAETQKAVAEPPLFKLIKQVHDHCCMSSPADGKLIVIDIDPATNGEDE